MFITWVRYRGCLTSVDQRLEKEVKDTGMLRWVRGLCATRPVSDLSR